MLTDYHSVTRTAIKNPPHPGDLIRTEIMEPLQLSVSKAAEILEVRRATLSDLLAGKAALSAETALRIEKAFGPGMDHLLRMQLAYDVAKTRQNARLECCGSAAARQDSRARQGAVIFALSQEVDPWRSR